MEYEISVISYSEASLCPPVLHSTCLPAAPRFTCDSCQPSHDPTSLSGLHATVQASVLLSLACLHSLAPTCNIR